MSPAVEAKILQSLAYDPTTGVFTLKEDHYYWRRGCPVGYIMKGYVHLGILGKHIPAHRAAWFIVHGKWPSKHIDHKNGIKTDNRIDNLRELSHAHNLQNTLKPRKDSTVGLKGVYRQGNRFVAEIQADNKRVYLGSYIVAEEAHAAYLEAKKRLHPGWAY